MLAVALGCSPGIPAATSPPQVDRSRIEASIEGSWGTGSSGDTVTLTEELTLRGSAIEVIKAVRQMAGPAQETRLSGRYAVSPTGAIEMRLTDAAGETHVQRHTVVVVEPPVCALYWGRPCRILGHAGFLAQSPEARAYRRELYTEYPRPGRAPQILGFVAELAFAHPLGEVVHGAACRVRVDVSAMGTCDGNEVRRAARSFVTSCSVEPRRKGPLHALRIDAPPSGAPASCVGTALSDALHTELYFDPAQPGVLLHGLAGGYFAKP
jgi:hypothetical protein